MKKILKIFSICAGILFLLLASLFLYVYIISSIDIPKIENRTSLNLKVEQISKDFYSIGKNKFKRSDSGLWELYVEGEPFERGVIIGKLTSALIYKQEVAFVKQLSQLVPSKKYLHFLKYFVGWFNRDIEDYIDKEYLEEIYGVSLFASNEFNYISDNYQRILNYHAAHDIGHALQGLSMVGCTSFSVWNDRSADSSLLVGRNFDFYVGDEFAEDKIVCFFNPNKGNKFVMISWGGMIGAVSGMNINGLTVTLNAAKSEPPFKAKTPISILAREILQYAVTIEEALTIAKKRETFVSEAIMIGSAKDNRTVIIEKTPVKTALYESKRNYIICSNHYQSDDFINDESNIENIQNSSSIYRFKRMNELIKIADTIDYIEVSSILRDRKGLKGKDIGMGNEKSINQLIAHHSVIFQPKSKIFWVSTAPYQLGKYVSYNLDTVFSKFPSLKTNKEIYSSHLSIEPDSFLYSYNYQNYVKYRKLKDKKVYKNIKDFDEKIIKSNPENYYAYVLAAEYNNDSGRYEKAIEYCKKALSKEIATNYERQEIYAMIKMLKTKIRK